MARDRPSPYGNPGRFLPSTRSGSGDPELRSLACAMHRDREVSPTGKTLIYETPSDKYRNGVMKHPYPEPLRRLWWPLPPFPQEKHTENSERENKRGALYGQSEEVKEPSRVIDNFAEEKVFHLMRRCNGPLTPRKDRRHCVQGKKARGTQYDKRGNCQH